MSEVMKPAGAWGWTVIGGKNPKNEEALKAAGIVHTTEKKKEKKLKEEFKKRGIKPTIPVVKD